MSIKKDKNIFQQVESDSDDDVEESYIVKKKIKVSQEEDPIVTSSSSDNKSSQDKKGFVEEIDTDSPIKNNNNNQKDEQDIFGGSFKFEAGEMNRNRFLLKEKEKQTRKQRKGAIIRKIRESNLVTHSMNDLKEGEMDIIKSSLMKLVQIMEILSEMSFGEIEDLYNFKEKEPYKTKYNELKSLLPTLEQKIAWISIDPAPITCGCVIMDIITKEAVGVDRRAFRNRSERSEIGFNNVLENVSLYFEFFRCPSVYVVIEDQKAGTLQFQDKIYNDQYFLESHSIQCAIKGIFGNSCIILEPSSVKDYFNFPTLDRQKYKNDETYRRAQYFSNKKHAVNFGMNHSSERIRKRVRMLTGTDDHNIYDCVVNGAFGAYSLDGITSKEMERIISKHVNYQN